MTVLELASSYNIQVLINRPLNAITSKGLVRLAEYSVKSFSIEAFVKQVKLVTFMEHELLKEKLPKVELNEEDLKKLEGTLTFGKKIDKKWTSYGTIEHFNDVIEHYFVPRINFLSAYFEDNITSNDATVFFNNYLKEVYKLLNMLSWHYKNKANQRSKYINLIINRKCAEIFQNLTLSQKAILLLNSVEGVNCVLVGARQEKYIEDIVPLLNHEKISNAKGVFIELKEELEKIDYTLANL